MIFIFDFLYIDNEKLKLESRLLSLACRYWEYIEFSHIQGNGKIRKKGKGKGKDRIS